MTNKPDSTQSASAEPSNYIKYRGKCKEFCEALCKEDTTLTMVRGHYYDAMWGQQAHWWCTKPDGTVVDPTKLQFPSEGRGLYVPFDGTVECSNCGEEGTEEDFDCSHGRYVFCSDKCAIKFCM